MRSWSISRKMCKFCSNAFRHYGEDFVNSQNPLNGIMIVSYLDFKQAKMVVNWDDNASIAEYFDIDINFCPMCGRKLRGNKIDQNNRLFIQSDNDVITKVFLDVDNRKIFIDWDNGFSESGHAHFKINFCPFYGKNLRKK